MEKRLVTKLIGERRESMKFWKYIELDDGIGHGYNQKEFPFWEMEIQGWNDNETFTDLTTLVVVRAIAATPEQEADFDITYFPPELKKDLMISKLVQEAIYHLREAIAAYQTEQFNNVAHKNSRR